MYDESNDTDNCGDLKIEDRFEADVAMQSVDSSELDERWNDAFEALHNQVNMVRFTATLVLLREAIECHKASCVIATLVMCRDTEESVLFALHEWRRHEERGNKLRWEGRMSLRSLIRWAKGNDVLTDQEAEKASEIADKGGLGSHFEQGIAKDRFEHISKGESYRVDVGSSEAKETILDAVQLLIAMSKSDYVKRRLST